MILSQEIQEMPYQDFVAKLVKSGEVMDAEISLREEELWNAAIAICGHADTLSQDAFLFFGDCENNDRSRVLEFKHMATGLVGESGELLDAIKKLIIYRKSVIAEHEGVTIADNVLEELGDLMFFHTGYNTIVIGTNWGEPDETFLSLLESFLKLWNDLYASVTGKITIEMAVQCNKVKLAKRYASLSYSDKQAHDRADKK